MTIARKIIHKFKHHSLTFLLRLAMAVKSPALAARVLVQVSWRVPENPTQMSSDHPVVLCLGRSIFVDDVKALAQFSGQIEYLVVRLEYFETIFRSFFSPSDYTTITETNYHSDETTRAGKNAYADFLRKLLPDLKLRTEIRAVMSGNFGYTMQQEVMLVAEELGLPFIVMHKEGLVGFGGVDFAAPYKNFRFPGTKILLYNERARQTLIEAGAPGIAADKMQVVGVPRLDRYAVKPEQPARHKQIVFFSFSPADRFHHLAGDQRTIRQIEQRSQDFHRWIMEFAGAHQDIIVTIKTKNARHYIEYVENIKRAAFPSGALANLIITNSGTPRKMIQDSMAVLGYNSTTLIEGLLAGKIIITPDLSDLLPENSTDFFQDYPDLLNQVRSRADLEQAIFGNTGRQKISPQRREEFLREYIYSADGLSSARAEGAIMQAIIQRSGPAASESIRQRDMHQP